MNEATLTRRKVLKRAGVAGAAVWTVPFLASSASADVGIEALREKCHNADNSPRCPQCGGEQPLHHEERDAVLLLRGHQAERWFRLLRVSGQLLL